MVNSQLPVSHAEIAEVGFHSICLQLQPSRRKWFVVAPSS
jgi:hypothetical protein